MEFHNSFIPYRPEKVPPELMQQKALAFFEAMNARRTVRQFSDRIVPLNVIEDCIRTAGTAPSGAHMQPWHFAVVTNLELKKQIRTAAEEEEALNYSSRMSERWKQDLAPLGTDAVKEHITVAPVLIIVFKQTHRVIEGELVKNYYVNESVGIACGFLIAALHNAGLATLTHTPTPMKFLSRLLGRPEHENPMVLLPVGYPAENAMVPDLSRKPLSEIMTLYP